MNRDSESNKQNGGHLPLKSAKGVLPTDNRVCRDYVWGICTKYTQCKFSHECDIETLKSIIQFCHDFQNPTGCLRSNCTYIHATSAEERLFREAGQIPADLAKRYAQIDANFVENIMPRKNTNYTNKPPPPPPETQPQPPPPPSMAAAVYQPRWFPMLPPPPPPPREPPHHSSLGASTNNVPAYNHQQQPMPHMPIIDTSKPPPPLPTNIEQIRHTPAVKRNLDEVEASTSKVRKVQADTTPGAREHCAQCSQWDLRNLVIETRAQKGIAETAMLALKIEKDRKDCNKISEFLLKNYGGMVAATPSTSASIPSSKDSYEIFNAVLSNFSEIPESLPNTSQSQTLRFLRDILNNAEGSSTGVLNNELDALFKADLSLNLDSILSSSSNSLASTSSALSNTNILATTIATPTHLPPPQAHGSHQSYQPHESQIQYPFAGNLSNGAGESTLPKSATSNMPSVPMPTANQPPPYISQSNYHYGMMGRPPPFQ